MAVTTELPSRCTNRQSRCRSKKIGPSYVLIGYHHGYPIVFNFGANGNWYPHVILQSARFPASPSSSSLKTPPPPRATMASSTLSPIVRVAAVQAESGWLDLQASVKKTCSLIADAAAGGAALVAFPECFVPGYPAWIWSRPMDPEMTTRYIANSLRVDSPEMEQIRAAAAAHNVSVVLGFSENDNNSLYISQATISGTSGELLMVRRKMKPTHVERTVFGDSSGDSLLNVADVPAVGRVGALACWEHTQPLLKYHTHSQREEIHVSAWPALVPHVAGQGHWGMGIEGCTALSQVYAVESGTFVVQATGLVLQPGIDLMNTSQNPVYNTPGGGGAAIFGPDGCRLTEPLPPTQEGLVFADLDKRHILGVRMLIDTCGHYSRPDLLWLGVDSRARKPVQYAHSKKAVEDEDKKI